MRKERSWLVPFTVMTALSACASSRSVMVGQQETEISIPDVPDALIQMRRNGCPDQPCPVYSIAIFSDGTAVYDGRANVGVVGRRALKLTAGDLRALVTTLDAMDFLDSPDECCVCPDGRPSTLVTLDYRPGAAATKTVVHDDRCERAPPTFSRLESQIDRATTAERLAALPVRTTAPLASQDPRNAQR